MHRGKPYGHVTCLMSVCGTRKEVVATLTSFGRVVRWSLSQYLLEPSCGLVRENFTRKARKTSSWKENRRVPDRRHWTNESYRVYDPLPRVVLTLRVLTRKETLIMDASPRSLPPRGQSKSKTKDCPISQAIPRVKSPSATSIGGSKLPWGKGRTRASLEG